MSKKAREKEINGESRLPPKGTSQTRRALMFSQALRTECTPLFPANNLVQRILPLRHTTGSSPNTIAQSEGFLAELGISWQRDESGSWDPVFPMTDGSVTAAGGHLLQIFALSQDFPPSLSFSSLSQTAVQANTGFECHTSYSHLPYAPPFARRLFPPPGLRLA
ncbi:hypothetical protein BDR22DRAFT_884716 [Usnea florida]